MNNNEHVNKNIIIAAATTAYALVGLSITCLMMNKAVKDFDKVSKKIEHFVDKHMVKKPTPAPNVKPECWGTGEEPSNTNEETNTGAGDDKSRPDDTIIERVNIKDPTPWDAPLE